MQKTADLNRYIELYKDFLHPNPNINSQAISLLRKDFRCKFKDDLINNLKERDIEIKNN